MSEPVRRLNEEPEGYSPKTRPDILNLAEAARRSAGYPDAFVLPDRSTQLSPGTPHNCPGYVTFANEFSYFLDYSGQGYGFADNDGWRCDVNYTLADVLTGTPCARSAWT